MPESHDFDSIVQMCIGDDVYTTADRVRFAVMFTDGRIGDLVVDIAPGETKAVTLPPNGKVVTIHRPLSTSIPDA
jgi:hypothetical protein